MYTCRKQAKVPFGLIIISRQLEMRGRLPASRLDDERPSILRVRAAVSRAPGASGRHSLGIFNLLQISGRPYGCN